MDETHLKLFLDHKIIDNSLICTFLFTSSNTLATPREELTYWKRSRFWERLRAGGEGDDRQDGWVASLTQWT